MKKKKSSFYWSNFINGISKMINVFNTFDLMFLCFQLITKEQEWEWEMRMKKNREMNCI